MFYIAESLLLAEGEAYSKHSAVIANLGRLFVRTGRVPAEYHRYLIEAQSQPNIGDYATQANYVLADATEQIERAARFLELALTSKPDMG